MICKLAKCLETAIAKGLVVATSVVSSFLINSLWPPWIMCWLYTQFFNEYRTIQGPFCLSWRIIGIESFTVSLYFLFHAYRFCGEIPLFVTDIGNFCLPSCCDGPPGRRFVNFIDLVKKTSFGWIYSHSFLLISLSCYLIFNHFFPMLPLGLIWSSFPSFMKRKLRLRILDLTYFLHQH